jgi:hypothetical protein
MPKVILINKITKNISIRNLIKKIEKKTTILPFMNILLY